MLVHVFVDINGINQYKEFTIIFKIFKDLRNQHISNVGWTLPKVHHMVFMVATVKIDFIFVY